MPSPKSRRASCRPGNAVDMDERWRRRILRRRYVYFLDRVIGFAQGGLPMAVMSQRE